MSEVRLRRAESSDGILLWKWRNDVEVRRWSFHSEEITLDEHMKWFNSSLDRDDVEIFVLEEESLPVGQIRLSYWYDELVIGYSIDKNYRGRHLGKKIIELAECMLKNDLSLRKDGEYFVAYVQKDNMVSRHIFKTLGFCEEEQRKWIKYVKKIEM